MEGMDPVEEEVQRLTLDELTSSAPECPVPDAFVQWSLKFGPGTLGRARVFGLTSDVNSPADIRLHHYTMKHRLQGIKFNHSFPVDSLLVFGQCTRTNLFFAFRADGAVYTFYVAEDAPPPTKVAGSFLEFLKCVALGTVMEEKGLRKLENVDGDESDSSGSDSELLPARTFKPHPKGPSTIILNKDE